MLRLFSTSAMIDAAFSAVWNLFRHVRPGKNAEPFVSIFCKPLNLHRSTLDRQSRAQSVAGNWTPMLAGFSKPIDSLTLSREVWTRQNGRGANVDGINNRI